MFGGFKATGQTAELWQLDTVMLLWTQIKAPFAGAMWPERRAFHASGTFSVFLNQAGLDAVKKYVAGMVPMANQIISSQPLSAFPVASRPDINARDEFNATVMSSVQSVLQSLKGLALETEVQYLVVHGGISQEVGGGTVGDLFIFDTLTRLWQVPGNFSATSDVRRSGRHKHVLNMLGRVLFVQGGQDDVGLKPASPAYLALLAADVDYSFPYSAWPVATDMFVGTASDAFDGGVPPSPLALAPTHLLSMPPIIFSSSAALTYVEGSQLSAFIQFAGGAPVINFPSDSSWGTVGMQVSFLSLLSP
jgi:hypothetical protein